MQVSSQSSEICIFFLLDACICRKKSVPLCYIFRKDEIRLIRIVRGMRHILLTLTLLLTLTIQATDEHLDSLVLARIFSYQQNFVSNTDSFSTNVYVKFHYQTIRRNMVLWSIPHGYSIANGERNFVSEQYSRMSFNGTDDHENNVQVSCTTIPHNRSTMPTLTEFLTPQLFNAALYDDHVLSPFNRENSRYYHYHIYKIHEHIVRIHFRPRLYNNTQLVHGQALVDSRTGYIEQAEINGEFDMIRFKTLTTQGTHGPRALLPHFIQTDIRFKFMGNDIVSHFEAVYDCPITLPDTLYAKGDQHLMDSIRPIALSADEQAVYEEYNRQMQQKERMKAKAGKDDKHTKEADSLAQNREDTPKQKRNYWEEIGWDMIGSNLVHTISTSSKNGWIKVFPLINPQYISYSDSKGFAYRIKLGARYQFNQQQYVAFEPKLGYNFKLHEFYYTLPFEFTYNDRLNGRILTQFVRDNHIRNRTILNEITEEQGDVPELENKKLDVFNNYNFSIRNVISPTQWLTLEAGFVYHYYRSISPSEMKLFNKPVTYNLLAPTIGIKIRPWKNAPMFSLDFERGLKNKVCDLSYTRWEADISYTHKMARLQRLNLRFGGGLYSDKEKNYFMDFANFRDNNLPESWDDDWAGNFQLLSADRYNASKYYLRSNISYESPLLAVSMIPLVGHYVERERVYLSSLSIAHTRVYSELGYGFTCRFFSMGLFAGFLNADYQSMGCKFTFELFRRW